MALVAGIGVYERGKYQARYGQVLNPYYTKWANMICRCYSKSYKKLTRAYDSCEVDPRFLKFQDFMLWAEKQKGFGNTEWHLDKDILSDESKVYSPETCVFVPKSINTLLNNCPTQRGKHKVGTNEIGSKSFSAMLYVNNKNVVIGYYPTQEEAFQAYKKAKENNIQRVAEEHKEIIDSRVYEKLINFEVTN